MLDAMNEVLVAGASGATGKIVVRLLHNRGVAVRGLVRNAARMRRDNPDVPFRVGDVRDRATLRGALDGITAVISTIGSRSYFGRNSMRRVDFEGTVNLLTEARRAGVRHFVLMSAFGIGRESIFLKLFATVFNEYFKWKEAAETALRESGMIYTIVRPVELKSRLGKKGVAFNQTAQLSLLRWVSRQDVAKALVFCLDHEQAQNNTFEIYEGTGPRAEDWRPLFEGLRPEREVISPRRTPLLGCRGR